MNGKSLALNIVESDRETLKRNMPGNVTRAVVIVALPEVDGKCIHGN